VATALDDLVQRADLDGLVRHVDDTCASRDFDHLLRVRDAARAAVDTGRQLWPIATLANFRLALWAPAHLAVRALDDTARQFMPGPVPEILAVHHTWRDLSAHLPPGHDRSLVAYERALRGDRIGSDEEPVLEAPIEPAPFEPPYMLAGYSDDGVIDDAPVLPRPIHGLVAPRHEGFDDDTVHVFRDMMRAWTAQSNGTARAVVVEGGLAEACGAVAPGPVRTIELTSGQALGWLAWAAASGGAHGKRRGAAAGRSEALWLLAVFTGLDDDWPHSIGELGGVLAQCRFHAYDNDEAPTDGWGLRLVIVDPQEGISAAFSAHDRV